MGDIQNVIGTRINELLAVNDKKQKELAVYLGVKDNVISYYCSGSRTPNSEQIGKIADFFNVSTDYLLGRTDVSTIDAEIKAICKYTGLSEISIYNLHTKFVTDKEFQNDNPFENVLDGVNLILENFNGSLFFSYIADIKPMLKRLSEYQKEFSNLSGIDLVHARLSPEVMALKKDIEYLEYRAIKILQAITSTNDDNLKWLEKENTSFYHAEMEKNKNG